MASDRVEGLWRLRHHTGYKSHTIAHMRRPGWPEAPALLEEIYNAEDALVVGGALITLLNNADRVKCACLAQLVNAIGPIMTETGGPAWRQTIFHPFALAARYGRGQVMRTRIEAPSLGTPGDAEVPCLLAAVVEDPTTGANAVFALNRHPTASLDLDIELRGLGTGRQLVEALELHHANLKAINTREAPDTVVPRPLEGVRVDGERVRARLKPLSWALIATHAERVALSPDADAGRAAGPEVAPV